ncbi:hypothetical protein [Lacticaseibacillus paracasei]|uniref:hypothetical protein n=1 Tax=Lacticaseibacillus paracasei TaxID=1597 RepID=UPI001D015EAC|nr:hypothetical protein [Lacticaseibacillus paracasei]
MSKKLKVTTKIMDEMREKKSIFNSLVNGIPCPAKMAKKQKAIIELRYKRTYAIKPHENIKNSSILLIDHLENAPNKIVNSRTTRASLEFVLLNPGKNNPHELKPKT